MNFSTCWKHIVFENILQYTVYKMDLTIMELYDIIISNSAQFSLVIPVRYCKNPLND